MRSEMTSLHSCPGGRNQKLKRARDQKRTRQIWWNLYMESEVVRETSHLLLGALRRTTLPLQYYKIILLDCIGMKYWWCSGDKCLLLTSHSKISMYTIPILLTLAAKSLFSRVQGDYIQRYNGVASSTISGGRQTGNWFFHDPRPAQLGSGTMIYITIEKG